MLALVLILLGGRKLPEIARGLGQGIYEFHRNVRELSEDLDQEARDAGESLGGIFGKAAAQAPTPENQVAELYDPAAFQDSRAEKRRKFRGLVRLYRLICHRLRRCFDAFIRAFGSGGKR